jgi:hypothetical protein
MLATLIPGIHGFFTCDIDRQSRFHCFDEE